MKRIYWYASILVMQATIARWHDQHGEVQHCMKTGMNITSPAFK